MTPKALTPEQETKALELINSRRYLLKDIAARFGVSTTTMQHLIKKARANESSRNLGNRDSESQRQEA